MRCWGCRFAVCVDVLLGHRCCVDPRLIQQPGKVFGALRGRHSSAKSFARYQPLLGCAARWCCWEHQVSALPPLSEALFSGGGQVWAAGGEGSSWICGCAIRSAATPPVTKWGCTVVHRDGTPSPSPHPAAHRCCCCCCCCCRCSAPPPSAHRCHTAPPAHCNHGPQWVCSSARAELSPTGNPHVVPMQTAWCHPTQSGNRHRPPLHTLQLTPSCPRHLPVGAVCIPMIWVPCVSQGCGCSARPTGAVRHPSSLTAPCCMWEHPTATLTSAERSQALPSPTFGSH